MFRSNMSPPSSGLKSKPNKKLTDLSKNLSSAYFWTLKMDAICSSELHGLTIQKTVRGKAIPVRGRRGPESCEPSRLPHFL
jgi:hypothetical protein